MERDVGEIKVKIDVLAAKPGKRWDAIVDKILLGIVAALVAYVSPYCHSAGVFDAVKHFIGE